LNKYVWDCRPNSSKYACSSSAELPGAVPQAWLTPAPGTPKGRVEARMIASAILKMDRQFSVYTPAGSRAGGPPASLLVLFDGETYLDPAEAVPTTLDNLIAASKIPPTAAVFVSTGGSRRLEDLVASERFADFVAKELVPWVRANYNVTRDPVRTAVGGFSAGGLAGAYIGLRHSAVFGNVLSQSGAFWWEPKMGITGDPDLDAIPEANGIAAMFAESRKLPLRFYLDAGTFEIGNVGSFGILEANRHLRDVLKAKGYPVTFQQFVGGHDGLSWRGTIADALVALFHD
jgi:enterochelin esterase family protein